MQRINLCLEYDHKAEKLLVCVGLCVFWVLWVCLGYANNKFVYFDGKDKKLARWVAVCGVWMAKKKKKKIRRRL